MPGTDTYLGLRAFVDELVRCGLRDAITSPGSRSTPLVLTLAREPRLRATSHLDERSAAFFALGLAKATGIPAALACTSGTAAANYAPAVIEAHEARVPLLVLTADRPPELRDVGAGQTIDQVKLYGSAAKWYFEVDDHPASAARVRWLRQLACRAFYTAIDGRPGPVHLNFALREPLLPDGDGVPDVEIVPGREGGRPWVTRPLTLREAAPRLLEGLEDELRTRRARADRRRPRRARPAPGRDAGRVRGAGGRAAAGRAALRRPPRAGRDRALRRAAARPRLGRARTRRTSCCASATSRPPSRCGPGWRACDALQVAFDPESAWQDPAGVVGTIVGADPRATLETLDRQAAAQAQGHVLARRLARGRPGGVAGDRRDRRAGGAERAAGRRRARHAAARRGDAGRRLLDADPRRRDVLPRPRDAVPGALQPRRERDRRDGLDRVRRRRGRRAG